MLNGRCNCPHDWLCVHTAVLSHRGQTMSDSLSTRPNLRARLPPSLGRYRRQSNRCASYLSYQASCDEVEAYDPRCEITVLRSPAKEVTVLGKKSGSVGMGLLGVSLVRPNVQMGRVEITRRIYSVGALVKPLSRIHGSPFSPGGSNKGRLMTRKEISTADPSRTKSEGIGQTVVGTSLSCQ
jgi:hypothetical protein